MTEIPTTQHAYCDPILSKAKGRPQYQPPEGFHKTNPYRVCIDNTSYSYCPNSRVIKNLIRTSNIKEPYDIRKLYVKERAVVNSFNVLVLDTQPMSLEQIENDEKYIEAVNKDTVVTKCKIKDTENIILNYKVFTQSCNLQDKTFDGKTYMHPANVDRKMLGKDYVQVNDGDYLVYHGSWTNVCSPNEFNNLYVPVTDLDIFIDTMIKRLQLKKGDEVTGVVCDTIKNTIKKLECIYPFIGTVQLLNKNEDNSLFFTIQKDDFEIHLDINLDPNDNCNYYTLFNKLVWVEVGNDSLDDSINRLIFLMKRENTEC